MKKYSPNVVPFRTRLALALGSAMLFAFGLVALITGHAYIPVKRGGILLSGLAIPILVFAGVALGIAAVIAIIDHYDLRPNEATYTVLKNRFLKYALYLFVAAPLVGVAEVFLRVSGFDTFPQFQGFSPGYTFYSPGLRIYTVFLEPIQHSPLLWITALTSIVVGGVLNKYFPTRAKKPAMMLLSFGMMCACILMLAKTTNDFFSGELKVSHRRHKHTVSAASDPAKFSGEVEAGRRRHKHTVSAASDPAKFNAILFTHFALYGFFFLGSAFLFVGYATDRIKPK